MVVVKQRSSLGVVVVAQRSRFRSGGGVVAKQEREREI